MKIISFVLVSLASCIDITEKKFVTQSHVLCGKTKQISGKIGIRSKHLFFWYFESQRNASDPLLIWLGGAPAKSVLFGNSLFPCSIKDDSVQENIYSWNDNANVLFVDLYDNVGFSSGASTGIKGFGREMYNFLEQFYRLIPSLKENPVHVFGESFGGLWIPEIVKIIVERNKIATKRNHINIKSAGIRSPLIMPVLQFHARESHPTYRCSLAQIKCAGSYSLDCEEEKYACLYEFTRGNPLIPESNFLNLESTKKTICPTCPDFNPMNISTFSQISYSWSLDLNSVQELQYILENNIKVLFYIGAEDPLIDCSDLILISKGLTKSHNERIHSKDIQDWLDPFTGEPIGKIITNENLTLVSFNNVQNHPVNNQPKSTLTLVSRWIRGLKI